MSIIKSFSVCDDNGEAGDMFYIKHNSSNFTIIDCCLNCEDRESIVSEIIDEKRNKNIIRVISTHPDEDHICGLDFLDDRIGIVNFYCVENLPMALISSHTPQSNFLHSQTPLL